jgi:type I restriction enzyme S subunit
VGKTGILGLEAATNQAVCGIFPLKNSFTAQYMVYWLQCNRRKLVDLSSGGAQPNISQGIIRSFPFPLAPLPEQRRIVAAIETHFSRLDAAVAKLKRIRTNLKRYRAAVLKAACEGRLVPQDPGDEPADHLLARILAERRRQWQAANPGKKYTDPAAPQRDDLPPLPSGWVWVRVEQIIAEQPTNGRSATTVENGFPVLRLTAIQHGTINLSERKLGAITAKDATPFFVQEEDFFISRGNGSLHLVGRCGLVEQSPDLVIYPDTMIRLRVIHSLCNNRYLRVVWESPLLRQQIEIAARTTAGIHKINQQDIKNFVFPLPPLAQQTRIVAEVEQRLSVIDAMEKAVTADLQRAARLRQAILKRAFCGRLVAQDPTDEPVSRLLERIQTK